MADEWQDIKKVDLGTSKDEWQPLSNVDLTAQPTGRKVPQGFWGSMKTMAGNIPGSAANVASGVVNAVTHPIDTAKNVFMTAMGDPKRTQAVGDLLANRYGGWKAIANTAVQDPAGMAMDISSLTGLAGAGAEIGGLSRTANVLSKTSEFTNPLSAITKPVSGLRSLVGKTGLPEELYARSMKIPPGSLKAEERSNVLKTLVRDEGLPLGTKFLNKINTTVDAIEKGASKVFNDLSDPKLGVGTEIDINKQVNKLDVVKNRYTRRGEPQHYQNAVDNVKRQYIEHDFIKRMDQEKTAPYTVGEPFSKTGFSQSTTETVSVPMGKASIMDANELKKGIYEEIQSYYAKGQRPETGRIGIQNEAEAKSKAFLASHIRREILNNPDVPLATKAAMRREAGLMNARKWVERATNRGGNIDVVSLSGMMFGVLVEKGIPGAVAYRIATLPAIQSRLAIALAHGSKIAGTAGKIARPVSAGAYQFNKFGDTIEQ